eukprot:TRINITY_DN689_c0_g1_i1.p1 TRINITY_DN689_c0_g1~~TRINITY_DN689_c0_g1_i1.p1  ORF type:complete len:418 (-),score=129.87 TRINITY_DN689_c0_g1_i1:229-1482(-)
MPKKSRRNPSKTAGKESYGSDDDSVFNDNASVISQLSDISVPNREDLSGGDAASIEDTNEELFEEKIKDALDMASQKSANGRVAALEGLIKAFSKKYIPYFVEDRWLTFCDVIERALKKGKASEQSAAANLAASLTIQLGPSPAAEDVYKTLKPTLLCGLLDSANSDKARSAMANSLGLICFLAGGEMAEVLAILSVMEKLFTQEGEILATAAVSSWSLLLTMIPSDRGFSLLESTLEPLSNLLKSPDVDLRIATGEAIAVLFEVSLEHDEDATFSSLDELCDDLRHLATDSNKHRSKKDRKEQRSSFRDILKTIEEGTDYYEKLSLSSRESLVLDSWASKKQYESICKVLLSGVNLHMTENELIRDIFDLGAPLPILSAHNMNKPSKYEKQLINSQAFKHRTKTRGKERDKRSAFV